MARNDDRAAALRAKRKGKGEDPSDPTDPEATGASPDPSEGADELVPAGDAEITDAERAENASRQGITGPFIDMEPGIPVQTDFDPPPGGEVVGGEVTKGGGPRVVRFLRASWAELRRVRWPNRQQVAQGTAVVIGFVILAGAFLGLADVAARALVKLVLGT